LRITTLGRRSNHWLESVHPRGALHRAAASGRADALLATLIESKWISFQKAFLFAKERPDIDKEANYIGFLNLLSLLQYIVVAAAVIWTEAVRRINFL
jgi:hypothetical protein